MNGINGYQICQNSYEKTAAYSSYGKPETKKTDNRAEQTQDVYGKSSVTETKKETVSLSDDAKKLLERLKEKYGNTDFIVANYDSDEEAQKYLAGGTKEYSVLIEPELLEKMAADEAVEKKYTDMIDEATAKLSEIKEQMGDDGTAVRLGVSFDGDGNMKFFADLEKLSEQQKERIEKAKEKKKTEEKEEDKKAEEKKKTEAEKKAEKEYPEPEKRVRVTADSAEELIEKINNIDWDQVKAQPKKMVGGIIDFGI